MKGGSAALFAEFVFFFVFAPDRGEMRGAAFFGTPVAVVERPQFPAAVVDALAAAERGAVPRHVLVEAEEIGAVAAYRVHFLAKNQDATYEIHFGETRVLAAFSKVLAVAQRPPRFGAPACRSVRRGAFSSAVKRSQILVRDERLGKSKGDQPVAGAPAFGGEEGSNARALLAHSHHSHEIGALFERHPVGNHEYAAQRPYLLHADVDGKPDPMRGALVFENSGEGADVHEGAVPRPCARQRGSELGLAAVLVERLSRRAERRHQSVERAQPLPRLSWRVSASFRHSAEPVQRSLCVGDPQRPLLDERVVFRPPQFGDFGKLFFTLGSKRLLEIPAGRLAREKSSYFLFGDALECFFEPI